MAPSPSPRSGGNSNSNNSNSSDAPASINTTNIAAPTFDPNGPRLRAPRTLPPWIDSYEEQYGPVTPDQLNLLRPPQQTVTAHHNTNPDETQRRVSKDGYVDYDDEKLGPAQTARSRIPHILRYGRASMRGRKWDHLRSADPVVVPGYLRYANTQTNVPWGEFVDSSRYGHMANEESEVMDYSEFEKLQPNFATEPLGGFNPLAPRASKRKRTIALYKRVWNLIMRGSFSPLIFRLIVMVTSIVALAVAGRIFAIETREERDSAEKTQSVVAIVVDCVAIPYLAWMIWDEYTGKPLGLRSGFSKMSLIMLDLFFIIFKSASTALAFESLVYHNVGERSVHALAKALAAFMLIALIVWCMNFTVNIFRLVQRLGGGEDDDRP